MTPSFHNFGLINYNRMNFSVVSSHQVCAITSAYITHLYYYLYYIMYCNIYCIICIQFVLLLHLGETYTSANQNDL